MPAIKRRQFLQFTGSALAAIGLNQLDVFYQGDRAARVLAQPAPRKLALLIGINQYQGGVKNLRGCLTDVQMQRQLLIHRFGFSPSDILMLTDETEMKPTRANILSVFESHLINQAEPGDVVVFHYSGHGSYVRDPDPIALSSAPGNENFQGFNGTILPSDARVEVQDGQVNDIMGKTLFLLMSALKTDQVTMVLDSCHSGGGTRGNVLIRSEDARIAGVSAQPSTAELDYQAEWMKQLGLTPEDLKARRAAGIAKGVAMGSAGANQLAADATFGTGEGQFFAGAFTYTLTHYLWQQPNSQMLDTVFTSLARQTRDVANNSQLAQTPVYQTAPDQNYENRPVYLVEAIAPSAEAVVLAEASSGEMQFWLGGVSSQSLRSFEQGAIFNLIDGQGNALGQVEQTRREGLVGYGTLQAARSLSASGMLLRERIRGVPNDLTMKLGLHPSLAAVLPGVQSEINNLNRMAAIAIDQTSTVDYLVSRLTPEVIAQGRSRGVVTEGEPGGIGLTTADLIPIEASFGRAAETAEQAIARLRPRLKMLLAGLVLRSVLNSDTSNLAVNVEVKPVQGGGTFARSSSRGDGIVAQRVNAEIQQLRPGTEIQIEVVNNEPRSLYLGILVIGSSGRITILHPVNWEDPEGAALVDSGQTVVVPQNPPPQAGRNYCDPNDTDENFHFCVSGTAGFFEVLVLASTQPLRDALKGIQQIAGARGTRSGSPLGLGTETEEDEPLMVVNALLSNLDQSTRADVELRGGVSGIDTEKLAALSVILEVVA
ncbi:caspase family protein [Sphaerothrix gracilis]|uniref:caspase family protein n=1 Tax=Sphaerothrix gracilis TaxID=3151835 RepID=UPI0031FD3F33